MKFAWLVSILTVFSFAGNITVMTEEWAPYNYEKEGKVKGISTEVVKAIQKRAGNDDPIIIQSWGRSYQVLEQKPNHALFSMSRLPQREALFKWVGPIADNETYFFKKKGSDIDIKNLEDAKKVKLIGAGAETNVDFIELKSKGFTNLSTLDTQSNPINLVVNNRVDLGGSNPLTALFHLKKNNFPLDSIVNTGVQVFSVPLYIAFSLETSDEVIKKWQDALDSLKASGEFDKIKSGALQEAYKDFGIAVE